VAIFQERSRKISHTNESLIKKSNRRNHLYLEELTKNRGRGERVEEGLSESS